MICEQRVLKMCLVTVWQMWFCNAVQLLRKIVVKSILCQLLLCQSSRIFPFSFIAHLSWMPSDLKCPLIFLRFYNSSCINGILTTDCEHCTSMIQGIPTCLGRLNTIFWSLEVCQRRLQILRKNVFCSIKLLLSLFCKLQKWKWNF